MCIRDRRDKDLKDEKEPTEESMVVVEGTIEPPLTTKEFTY